MHFPRCFGALGRGMPFFFLSLSFLLLLHGLRAPPPPQPLASPGRRHPAPGTFRCLCCPLKVLAPAPSPSTALGAPGLLLLEAFALKVISRIKPTHAFVCLVFGVFWRRESSAGRRGLRVSFRPVSQKNPKASPAQASSHREVSCLPFAGGVYFILVFRMEGASGLSWRSGGVVLRE